MTSLVPKTNTAEDVNRKEGRGGGVALRRVRGNARRRWKEEGGREERGRKRGEYTRKVSSSLFASSSAAAAT